MLHIQKQNYTQFITWKLELMNTASSLYIIIIHYTAHTARYKLDEITLYRDLYQKNSIERVLLLLLIVI